MLILQLGMTSFLELRALSLFCTTTFRFLLLLFRTRLFLCMLSLRLRLLFSLSSDLVMRVINKIINLQKLIHVSRARPGSQKNAPPDRSRSTFGWISSKWTSSHICPPPRPLFPINRLHGALTFFLKQLGMVVDNASQHDRVSG